MTTASDVSDSNWRRKHLERAGYRERVLRNCGNRKLIYFCGIFFNLCANSLYCGGPKTLLTDQHFLRTNLFFVTETSELRLAGLHVNHSS